MQGTARFYTEKYRSNNEKSQLKFKEPSLKDLVSLEAIKMKVDYLSESRGEPSLTEIFTKTKIGNE